MTRRPLLATLLGIVVLAPAAFSAPPSPTALTKLGNMAFGWISTSGNETTADTLSKYAAQTVVLKDRGKQSAAEFYNGTFGYSGFDVDTDTQSVLMTVGPGVARIARKSFKSNIHALAKLPGLPVQLDGEAYELSYAQRFGNTAVGLSIVPKDNTALHATNGATTLIKGWTRSNTGARLGVTQSLLHGVKLGVDYSYQEFDTEAVIYKAYSGAPVDITQTEQFLQRCISYGASWQCNPKTTLYLTEWDILDTGSVYQKRESNVTIAGVKYLFTPNINATVNSHNGRPNFHMNWITRNGIVQLDYTDGAIPTAEDLLGHGHSLFVGLTVMK
ncbi:MAG: hypothetical protein ACYC1M_07940 [Armatimonadota bacterium]